MPFDTDGVFSDKSGKKKKKLALGLSAVDKIKQVHSTGGERLNITSAATLLL